MSLDHVDVVRGRTIVRVPAAEIQIRAVGAARVVVDVGAGDGRLAYRLARAHPDWLCLAVDACAAGMRRLSRKADRKPSRGGAPNALFVRASVESLPRGLAGIADEVTVFYPWGSLLRAVVEPEKGVLSWLVQLGRPGATLRIRVNESALPAAKGAFDRWLGEAAPRLERGYAALGVTLDHCGWLSLEGETSWGARLHGGRRAAVLAIEGTLGSL